jgi:nondiscriminating glutamyl-tRNA synthetase
MSVRVRMAPSPTGGLHIGTVRTALFNYLYAKHYDGDFVLRIEDTDKERSEQKYENDILSGLKWLGILPNEGVIYEDKEEGSFGPYHQKDRQDIYKQYLKQLIDEDKAYPCFCTSEELDEQREKARQRKIPFVYNGTCRHLSSEEQSSKKSEEMPYVIRFKILENQKDVIYEDMVRGEITFAAALFDDFVIAKKEDQILFNFANVIDDHLMEITHVIRGEDHISNIPKQVVLYEAFGWKYPEYAHIPLLLNTDKTKMSKRNTDNISVLLEEYIKDGFLPEALVNALVMLGWNDGTTEEFYTKDELIEKFSLDRVQKGGAVYDYQRILWMNKKYISKMTPEELGEKFVQYAKDQGYLEISENKYQTTELCHKEFSNTQTWEVISQDSLLKILPLIQSKASLLKDIFGEMDFCMTPYIKLDETLLGNEKMKVSAEEGKQNIQTLIPFLETIEEQDWKAEILKEKILPWIKEQELKNGQVLWPMRAALTNKLQSPGAFEVAELFGKTESLRRLQNIFI